MTLLARLVVRGGVNVAKKDTPIGIPIISPATTTITPAAIEEGSVTPVTGSIAVTNGGSDALSGLGVSAVTYISGSGWLTPTWDSGNSEVDWSLDPTGLLEGNYSATFQITASNATAVTISCDVEIYTVSPGTYDAPLYSYPTWLTFSTATDKFSGEPFASVNPDTYFTGTNRSAGTTQASFASALAASTGDGDILELTAGTTIDIANVQTVPGKASGWILIRSSGYASLPAEGTRIDPTTHAAALATLRATSYDSILRLSQGYAGVYFQGIKFIKDSGASNNGSALVDFGAATQTQLSHVPTHVEMRHCVVTNPWAGGGPYSRRGIFLRSRYTKIKDCYIDGHGEFNSDSQAIAILSTPGDYEIHNCFLEATTENVMSGGSTSSIGADGHCSNGWIHQNYFYKRPAWLTGGADATLAAPKKNFFELKCAQRVVFEGNVCDNFDGSGQQNDLNFGNRPNSSAEQAWCYVKDVWARYNKFNNSAGAALIHNTLTGSWFVPNGTQRIECSHNRWGTIYSSFNDNSSNRLSLVASKGITAIAWHHNVMHSRRNVFAILTPYDLTGTLAPDVTLRDNINFMYATPFYGPIYQDGGPTNNTAMDNLCGSGQWNVESNVQLTMSWGATLAAAPYNNKTAASLAAIGFTDTASDDYSLAGGSTYKNTASDGGDPGVNQTRLTAITAGVTTGTPTETY